MTPDSAVGVVVPFWQREPKLLRRAIKSVYSQQTAGPVKIIVVDDGSPVSAKSELQGLSPPPGFAIRQIEQVNGRVAAARNVALDALAGQVRYAAFLDSDDIWRPQHLRRMLTAFGQGAEFYFTDYRRPDEDKTSFEQNSYDRLSRNAPVAGLDNAYWLQGDFLEIVLRNSPVGLSTVGYQVTDASTVRFPADFRRACEDRLFFAELSRQLGRVAFSTDCDVIYGTGSNLFKEALFGTPAGAERIKDSAHFHARLGAEFPLTQCQRTWNRLALASLDRQFIETVLIHIANDKIVNAGTIKSYIRLRPWIFVKLPPTLYNILLRKLRKELQHIVGARDER